MISCFQVAFMYMYFCATGGRKQRGGSGGPNLKRRVDVKRGTMSLDGSPNSQIKIS